MIQQHENWNEISECTLDKFKPNRCQEIIESQGLEIIGTGEKRVALTDGDKIIKFPQDEDGMRANVREADIWESSSDSIRTHLAAVEDHHTDGKWLVMERAEDIESASSDHSFDVRDVLQNEGLDCPDIRPIKNNVGMIDQTPIVVDYEDCQLG